MIKLPKPEYHAAIVDEWLKDPIENWSPIRSIKILLQDWERLKKRK